MTRKTRPGFGSDQVSREGSAIISENLSGRLPTKKELTTHMWVIDCMKVDASLLAAVTALRYLGTKYKGEDGVRTWHYFACPTRHGFKACDRKCRDAREALA